MRLAVDLAKGNTPGHSIIQKFGSNRVIGATVEDIWSTGGVYVWPQQRQPLK
jgi:hypothetical protein